MLEIDFHYHLAATARKAGRPSFELEWLASRRAARLASSASRIGHCTHASMPRHARGSLALPITAIALRVCPRCPRRPAERVSNYQAHNVADSARTCSRNSGELSGRNSPSSQEVFPIHRLFGAVLGAPARDNPRETSLIRRRYGST